MLDTEYQARTGELQKPVCLSAIELVSGKLIEVFFDQEAVNPFIYDDATLFVGFNLPSEWKTLIELGWQLPEYCVDLYSEFLRVTNRRVKKDRHTPITAGHSLLDACQLYGIDTMSHLSKSDERNNIISHGIVAPEAVAQSEYRRRVLDYCAEDVTMTVELLFAMLPWLDMKQALVRGSYSVPVAWCERNGLPLDVPFMRKVVKYRDSLRAHLARKVEAQNGYNVYEFEGEGDTLTASFSQEKFVELVKRLKYTWPKTPTGKPRLDADTFKEMAEIRPVLAPLKELKKSEAGLKNFRIPISSDGKNRSSIHPFGQAGGRNNHKGGFLLGGAKWLRFAMQPPPGYVLIACDIKAEEFALGAAFAADRSAIETCNAGVDQYLDLAIRSGHAPVGATKKSHGPVRKKFKTLQLAGQYGAGAKTVAQRLGCFKYEAEILLAGMRKVQAQYWQWSDGQVSQAKKLKHIETVLGWRMAVTPELKTANGWKLGTKPNTIINWPIQSHGAEILRVAMILLVESGAGEYLVGCQHDSAYVLAPAGIAERMKKLMEDAFTLAGWLILRRVQGAVPIKLLMDTHTYQYPERYEDEDGEPMHKIVREFLDTKSEVSDEEWLPLYTAVLKGIEEGRKKKAQNKRTLDQ